MSIDVKKLYEKLCELSPDCHRYLLIAGKKKKLNDSLISGFVKKHKENDREYIETEVKIETEKVKVKLRPSRKQMPVGDTFVMTWEVLGKKI